MMMRGIVLLLLAVVTANAIPKWKPRQNAPQQKPQETRSLLKGLMDELEEQRDNKVQVADKEVDVYERWKEGCNDDTAVYSTATGEITTPGWNRGYYPNDARCRWQIQAPEGQNVEVTFVKLDLEAAKGGSTCGDSEIFSGDYIMIWEGNWSDLLVWFCGGGYVDNSMVVTSTGTMLSIKFRSDASVTKRGFKLTWRFVSTVYVVCGGALTGAEGSFTSPDFDTDNITQIMLDVSGYSHYPDNARCEWTITVSPDKLALVVFEVFELEYDGSCMYDYVEIYDGDSVLAPVLGKYCGGVVPQVTTGSANTLTVVFNSDDMIHSYGFLAFYFEKDVSEAGEVSV